VLEGPSLSVTLTTGTCAVVKNSTQGKDLSDLLEDSLTCVGPELSYTKVCALTCVAFSTDNCCVNPILQSLVRVVSPPGFACSAPHWHSNRHVSMPACICSVRRYRLVHGNRPTATQGAPQHIVCIFFETPLCSCDDACVMQSPAVFVSQYQSAASFSTKSCQLSVNTTDYFTKVLYSGGADVTYSSVQDFITALTNGDFVMGMTPSEQFVQVSFQDVSCQSSHQSFFDCIIAADSCQPCLVHCADLSLLPAPVPLVCMCHICSNCHV